MASDREIIAISRQEIRQKIFKNDPFQLDMQTKMDTIRK